MSFNCGKIFVKYSTCHSLKQKTLLNLDSKGKMIPVGFKS